MAVFVRKSHTGWNHTTTQCWNYF